MNQLELLELNLDKYNKELWEEINRSNNINLEASFEPNYITNFIDDIITIYIDLNNIKPSSFTHELLHIKLKNQGVLVYDYLKSKIKQSENLNYIFSKDLEDHIGNCLEHIKMFPLFIKMGYKDQDFLSDFKTRKLKMAEVKHIQSNFKTESIINRPSLDLLIGKFFAAKACLNGKKYIKELSSLRKIDITLYDNLKDFWLDWEDYSIDEPSEAYEEIISIFIEELDIWAKNKTIV